MEHRRKWDRSEYERMAQDRISREIESLRTDRKGREEPTKRELLKARDQKVNLEANLNKSVVITKTGPGGSQAGYFCQVCDCVVKDSINYLDHINGKKHQRNLGMSMRVERSSLEDVKLRFEELKNKKIEEKKDYNFEERVAMRAEEEGKLKEYRRERKKEKRRQQQDMSEFVDADVAAAMGFSGFSDGKKARK